MAPRTTTGKRTSRARSGTRSSSRARNGGKLRIGDHWNAITIIALSHNSPLKAIAEFVENSIDANARNVTIVRGREQGEHYLRVVDDGEGIRLNSDGVPDFAYVATHICDSIAAPARSWKSCPASSPVDRCGASSRSRLPRASSKPRST